MVSRKRTTRIRINGHTFYHAPFITDYDALYAPINDANKNWPDYGGFAWQNPHTKAQGSALADQKDTQWVILATAMPSVSFAAAANAVDDMDGIDMNGLKNGWPDMPERGEYLNDWQHDDFVTIGATFVKMMYDKCVEKGSPGAPLVRAIFNAIEECDKKTVGEGLEELDDWILENLNMK